MGEPAAAHVGTVVHRELQRIAEQGLKRGRRTRSASAPKRSRGSSFCSESTPTRSPPHGPHGGRRAARPRRPSGRWVLAAHPEARSSSSYTARRRAARARAPRPHVRGRRHALDHRLQDEPPRRQRPRGVSRVGGRALSPAARPLCGALATIDSRPVQVGLYFPLLATLRAWPASARASP
jgi:hypothetical protein